MTTTIEAVYEGGNLRPLYPIALAEGQHVDVVILAHLTDERFKMSLNKKTPGELLAEIAAMPLEPSSVEFSGRDHDKILYGEKSDQ